MLHLRDRWRDSSPRLHHLVLQYNATKSIDQIHSCSKIAPVSATESTALLLVVRFADFDFWVRMIPCPSAGFGVSRLRYEPGKSIKNPFSIKAKNALSIQWRTDDVGIGSISDVKVIIRGTHGASSGSIWRIKVDGE